MLTTTKKKCGCCGREYSAGEWFKLPHVGIQHFEYVDGSEDFDMRNCPCGSTLGVLVKSITFSKEAA